MLYSTDYFWVVICKNRRFHHKSNLGYEHRIVLGEADAFSPMPMLTEEIQVRCDSCAEEYSYKRKEVLRAEIEVPQTFVAHPLFESLNGTPPSPKSATATPERATSELPLGEEVDRKCR